MEIFNITTDFFFFVIVKYVCHLFLQNVSVHFLLNNNFYGFYFENNSHQMTIFIRKNLLFFKSSKSDSFSFYHI